MKSARTTLIAKYAIVGFIVLTLVANGYRSSQPAAKHDGKQTNGKFSKVGKSETKAITPGSACCKASFSRAKMLSVKSAHFTIAPSDK